MTLGETYLLSDVCLLQSTEELGVVRHSNVYKTMYVWNRCVGWVERGILDTISVDLSDVQVLLDLFDSRGDNVISHPPDSIAFSPALLIRLVQCKRRREDHQAYRIVQSFPEAAFYQGDHAARGIGSSPMVLA